VCLQGGGGKGGGHTLQLRHDLCGACACMCGGAGGGEKRYLVFGSHSWQLWGVVAVSAGFSVPLCKAESTCIIPERSRPSAPCGTQHPSPPARTHHLLGIYACKSAYAPPPPFPDPTPPHHVTPFPLPLSGRGGYGFVLFDLTTGRLALRGCMSLPYGATVGTAEFEGLLAGLQAAYDLGIRNLAVQVGCLNG